MARLLVADNSPFYRDLLAEALVERGHQVRTVGDGLEALQALGEEPADAVVLDLVMPKVNGARACRQIKANPETAHIPVVILSGLREDEIDDPRGIGADAYVAKMQAEPMLEHLVSTLEELLAGRLQTPMRGFDAMHRREVVSELLEERRSRDALLGSLNEGVIQVDEEGRVMEANAAALRMLGVSEAGVMNRPVSEILGLDEKEVRALLSSPEPGRIRRLSACDRTLEARVRRPAPGPQRRERFILLADVTGEERIEAERRELEEKVRAAERMSSLGEIVSGIAHELNNPLTGVIGYADLLLELAPDERTRARLKRLHHEAQRCRRVVENLLCFARKRHSYRRPHDLNALVQGNLAAQAVAAEKAGVRLVQELGSGLPHGLFDVVQMEQVLGNLLANALQAVASVPHARRVVTVRTAEAPGRVVLEVEDRGTGIPAEIRDRIFEPFFTTHRPEGATGLGLAVSYGIVEEHGGHIEALAADPGTRMRIELPLAASEEVHHRAPSGRQADGEPRRPAVLIVDDEPVILDLVEDVLTDSGFHVERAANGVQALERLGEGEFQAMLIDLKMPHMDGRRLYEAVTERRPELARRVVFTTGDLDDAELSRFLKESGSTLLRKPFRLEEVANTFLAVAGVEDRA